jgi:hypothetical protein
MEGNNGMKKWILSFLWVSPLFLSAAMASPPKIVISEGEVPAYQLPDVRMLPTGEKIEEAAQWTQVARPALIREFEKTVYGKTPELPVVLGRNDSLEDSSRQRPQDAVIMVAENERTRSVFGGKATLRQAELHFRYQGKSARFTVLVFMPRNQEKPVPVFIGLNFWGNHTINANPAISRSPEIPSMRVEERGSRADRWNVERLIDAGYAVATAFRGEIAPENRELYGTAILRLFEETLDSPRMGAIGAWAWALSRILDYMRPIHEIDEEKAIVIGHSRLGKAALWAGAQDTRFCAVIANCSGAVGAALSRRRFGESMAIITRNFPYWFPAELPLYADNENALPIDQHQLLALMAPRPLLLGSAEEDLWADPQGEYLALLEAQKIYQLFGIEENLPGSLPAVNRSQGEWIRFHRRSGGHDINQTDWDYYLDFANDHLKNK